MKKSIPLFLLVFPLSLSACGDDLDLLGSMDAFGLEGGSEFDETGGGSELEAEGEEEPDGRGDGFDRDDCKLEDGDLGRTDVELRVGGSTVRVSSWEEKEDSPGEYVGFTLVVAGDPVTFRVKAGGEVHEGSGGSWHHPNGSSGPEVPGISHIDFCENCEPGAPCGDGEVPGEEPDEGQGEEPGEGECYVLEPEAGFVPCTDGDGDGLSDEDEKATGTDPASADTDGDGLADGVEVVIIGTDPNDRDTDDGGVGDGDEVDAGSDPLDPADDGEGCLFDPEAGYICG